MAPASCRFAEEFAADQHAADLRGAGADLVELGVPQEPSGREFVDVAVSAEDLDRLQGELGRLLGSEKNAAGGVLAVGLAAITGGRNRIDIGARGIGDRVHVRKLALYQLELADRTAELAALMHIRDYEVEARCHDTE